MKAIALLENLTSVLALADSAVPVARPEGDGGFALLVAGDAAPAVADAEAEPDQDAEKTGSDVDGQSVVVDLSQIFAAVQPNGTEISAAGDVAQSVAGSDPVPARHVTPTVSAETGGVQYVGQLTGSATAAADDGAAPSQTSLGSVPLESPDTSAAGIPSRDRAEAMPNPVSAGQDAAPEIAPGAGLDDNIVSGSVDTSNAGEALEAAGPAAEGDALDLTSTSGSAVAVPPRASGKADEVQSGQTSTEGDAADGIDIKDTAQAADSGEQDGSASDGQDAGVPRHDGVRTEDDRSSKQGGVFALYEAATAATSVRSHAVATGVTDQSALVRNLSAELRQAVTEQPDGTVEVTLSPDDFGHAKVSLRQEDGGISVSVQTDRQDTIDVMRRHVDSLVRDMRELGFADVTFTFNDRSGSAQQQGVQTAEADAAGEEYPPDASTPVNSEALPRKDGRGALDLRM